MKYLTLISLIVVITSNVYTQEVISTASGQGTVSNVDISWTLGETFISTHESDNIILTEGIQQPLVTITSDINNVMSIFNNIKFYPNPAIDYVILDFNELRKQKYVVSVIDLQGRLLMQQNVRKDDRKFMLNVQKLSHGTYQLVISDGNEKQVFTMIKQ